MLSVNSDAAMRFITDALAVTTLEAIMDIAHGYVNNPLVLYDFSYRVVHCSDENDLDDGMWLETYKNRQQSFDTVKSYISAGIMTPQFQPKNFDPTQPTILNPNPVTDEKVRRLIIAVTDRTSVIVGWLVIFEHKHEFIETDKSIIFWLSKLLTPHMDLYFSEKAGYLDRVSNVMIDILNSASINEDFALQLKSVKWTQHRNNWLLAVNAQNSVYPQAAREYLRSELRAFFDGISDFIYNGYLVLVLASTKGSALDKSVFTLERVLKELNLTGAVSACFPNIINLRKAYKQAVNCLAEYSSAPNGKQLALFDEYAINILCRRASRYFSLKEYCHPAIFDLQEYDQMEGTDYLITLREFVMNIGNLKSAAYSLNIHRNTLVYRIERIKDILNLDVDRQDILKNLYVSFIIYDSVLMNDDGRRDVGSCLADDKSN